MLKMTHEILLLWEAQAKFSDYVYENTVSQGIFHQQKK